MSKEATPERKIIVPKDLSHPHTIIRAWLENRRQQRQAQLNNPYGVALPSPRPTDSERRRLRVLSALLKTLEKRGHKVGGDPRHLSTTWVMIGQEKIEFTLSQRQRQVKIVLSPKEKAEPYNAMMGRQFRTELQATDELVFKLHLDWWPDRRVRTRWRDKPVRPLEAQLNDIVAGLVAAAAVQREHEWRRRRRHADAGKWNLSDGRDRRK